MHHPQPQERQEHQQLEVAQLLYRNVNRFRGGLVFKAHGPLYHSTPGLKVITKKKELLSTLNTLLHTEEEKQDALI